MSSVSIDDVKKLASMSGLQVTDEEIAKLTLELEEILDFVEQLDSIDTKGVEPTYQVTGLKNVMREDKPIEYDVSQEELLKNAPDQQDGQIKVGRVL